MSTLINGNNINATTRGLVEAWSVTEQINLPPLNQSQVNALGTPAFGSWDPGMRRSAKFGHLR